MAFTDKMRDSLGAEGARLELTGPAEPVDPGTTTTAKLVIVGGTKAAQIETLTLRVIEARRHWKTESGEVVSEQDVTDDQRKTLTPGWERATLSERRIEVNRTVDPEGREEIELEVAVPADCAVDTLALNHNLFVQADIKGQIDPTVVARLPVG